MTRQRNKRIALWNVRCEIESMPLNFRRASAGFGPEPKNLADMGTFAVTENFSKHTALPIKRSMALSKTACMSVIIATIQVVVTPSISGSELI